MNNSKIISFIKKEIVLVISFLLGAASCFVVKPDSVYIEYIDFRTLALLFSLMLIIAGFNSLGVFSYIADMMLKKVKSIRGLALILVAICFFMSMLITNDVALITFVPFTVIALKLANAHSKMPYIVILETIAANLGSMLTPLGNPQNLYLYSAYDMSFGALVGTMLPYSAISLAVLLFLCLFAGKEKIELTGQSEQVINSKKHLVLYLCLFVVALLCVLRALHYSVALVISVAAVLIADRRVLKKVDYSLLLTFVFLFVFIGNLGRIEAVNNYLEGIVNGNEVIAGVLCSQVISNVPAAILLSRFTDNVKQLLIGVNIGGLGTLIASMASLISFKFIQKEKINTLLYILGFTLLNLLLLVVNYCLNVIS